MKIIDMLKTDYILEELKSGNKRDVLKELVGSFMKIHQKLDSEATLNVLFEREKLGSTGIGEGIAIPHGKITGLDQLILSFGRSAVGIDFDAMDGKPVHLFFLLIAPENSAGQHLKTLAKIAKDAGKLLVVDAISGLGAYAEQSTSKAFGLQDKTDGSKIKG